MGTKSFDNYADLITFSRASSATYLDSDGVLKTATTNTPRIEYDADGNRLGLLIEEQRTNLVTYSEEFDNAAWGKAGTGGTPAVSVVANQAIAPDGTLTADKLIPGTSAGTHYLQQTVTAYTSACLSLYAKAAEQSKVRLALFNSGIVHEFDLAAGTSSGAGNGTITDVGNGWYRCSVAADGASNTLVQIYTGDNSAGDGSSGIYIWGAQLEQASFPTSYIPTSGSTATRAADVASIPTSDFGYNQREGTVVQEFSTANTYIANENAFSDGTNDNRIMWGLNSNAGRAPYISSGGTNTVALINNSGLASGVQSKLGIAFASNDVASSLDGGAVATDTSATIPSQITILYLGVGAVGSGTFINGHIKSIKYYPRRLSNDQLQELTQ